MKNKNRLLTCTLGLMLGVGLLVGCGPKEDTTVHKVTFYHGNEELKSEEVKHGEKCPEYTPADRTGYTFMGWYENRQHTGEPFSFDTPIEADLDLYAWYKEDFKATTDKYYLVGSIWEDAWDGAPGTAYDLWKDRDMTLVEAELANSRNVFEYEFEATEGNKFRIIKASKAEDGTYASDGWTDAFGYTTITKVVDKDGVEVTKDDYVSDADDHNIMLEKGGSIKLTMDVTDPTAVSMVVQYVSVFEVTAPEYISLVGNIASKGVTFAEVTDIDLTSSEEGFKWDIDVTLTEGDEFKLRANHDWAVSYGAANLGEYPEGITALEGEGGNIGVSVTADYHITFSVMTKKIDITVNGGVVVNPLTAVYEAAVGDAVEFDAVYLSTHGSYNFFAHGSMGVVVYQYGLALPDGTAAGDVLHVTGTVGVYKGLVQVVTATATASEAQVTAKTDTVWNGEAFGKTDLGKSLTMTGTVLETYQGDSTVNATVKIEVNGVALPVYINKNMATLDYTSLATALVAGQTVTLKGYLSIFDGAAEVDYTTSTGYQLIFPSVVVAD